MIKFNDRRLLQIDLLEILQKYSNENHRLIQQDIIDILKSEYGYEKVRRQTVKDNLVKLISHYDSTDSCIGYEDMKTRDFTDEDGALDEAIIYTDFYYKNGFTNSELLLIIDSILFSKQISQKDREQLIEKLEGLSDKNFNSRMGHISSMADDNSFDKELFENIKKIDQAITESKQLSFKYTTYNVKGNEIFLEAKKKSENEIREYIINPYYMAVANGRYYLICNNDSYDNLSNYRIDKISDIKKTNKKRKPTRDVQGMGGNFDLNKYMKERIYMFGGESEDIKLSFSLEDLDEMIDWFGINNIIIQDKTDNRIIARVKVNRMSMKKWALRYALHVRVLSPLDLVEEIKEDIQKSMRNYE